MATQHPGQVALPVLQATRLPWGQPRQVLSLGVPLSPQIMAPHASLWEFPLHGRPVPQWGGGGRTLLISCQAGWAGRQVRSGSRGSPGILGLA